MILSGARTPRILFLSLLSIDTIGKLKRRHRFDTLARDFQTYDVKQ
jgi:hypothetical protein